MHRTTAALVVVSCWFLANAALAAQARPDGQVASGKTNRVIPISLVFKLKEGDTHPLVGFEPSVLEAKDGDSLMICNKTDPAVHTGIFSYSPHNNFGGTTRKRQPLKILPGKCVTVTVHNPTNASLSVKIFDEIHSKAKLAVTVAPGGCGGARSTQSVSNCYPPAPPTTATQPAGGCILSLQGPPTVDKRYVQGGLGNGWTIPDGGGTVTWAPPFGQATYQWTMPQTIPAAGTNVTLSVNVTAAQTARFAPAIGITGGVSVGAVAEPGMSNSASGNAKLVPSQACGNLVVTVGIQDGPTYTYTYVKQS